MSPQLVLVLDAVDTGLVADFWADALGYRRRPPVGQYEVLTPPEDSGHPMLLVQGVAEAKTGKNRMHLDLHVPDGPAEIARLVALGATVLSEGGLGELRWTTMADPEGNEFDLVQDD